MFIEKYGKKSINAENGQRITTKTNIVLSNSHRKFEKSTLKQRLKNFGVKYGDKNFIIVEKYGLKTLIRCCKA